MVEIDKAVLGQSLKEHPELLTQLSELLAQRQLHTRDAFADGESAAAGQPVRESSSATNFVHKLRAFFQL